MQNHPTRIRPAPDIHLTAYVKPEALAFFGEHGCMIQQRQQGGDLVIFPPGSRQEPLSSRSRRWSAMLLLDGTTITAIECCTKYIVLLIDIVHGQTTHLGGRERTQRSRRPYGEDGEISGREISPERDAAVCIR